MTSKQIEIDKKNTETAEIRFFKLTDLFRTFEVPHPLTVAPFVCHSVFYVMSIITKAYNNTHESSFIVQIASFFLSIQLNLGSFLEDSPSALLIISLYAGIIGLFSFITISLFKNQRKETQRKFFKRVFCVMSYFLAIPVISVIGAFLLILFYVFGFWVQEIISSNLSTAPSHLTKIYSWNDGAIQVSKLVISNLTLLEVTNFPFFFVLIIVSGALLSLLELYQILFIAKYYYEQVQAVYSRKVLLDSIVVTIALLVLLIPDPLILSNILLLHVVLFFFSSYSLSVYIQHRSSYLILSSPSQLKTEAEALTFVLDMIKLATNKHTNPVLKPYLLENHLQQCKQPHCFCSKPPKEGNSKLSQSGRIVNELILKTLEDIKQRFCQSILVFSLIMSFKVTLNPSFSGVKHSLKSLHNDHLNIYQKYLLYQMDQMIDNQVGEVNSTRKNLPLESVIKETATVDLLKDNISKIIDEMIEKYKLISVEFVRLHEVAIINDKINASMKTIETMWQVHCQDSSNYNIEQDFLYLLYFQALIPSHRQAHELKKMLAQKTKRLSSIKGLYKKNSFIAMYSKRTCILESVFDAKLGVVTNASRSVVEVLKAERNDVIGTDIHSFMPSFFAKGHRQRLQKWVSKENYDIFSNDLTNCYTADTKHIAFSAYSYVKVHSDGASLKMYKMIIRDNDRDYLILNKNGGIEAIGSRLTELGVFSERHLDADISSMVSQNILLKDNHNEKEWILIRPAKFQKGNALGRSSISINSIGDEAKEETVFQCWVKTKKQQIGNFSYYVVQFLEIKQVSAGIDLTLKQQSGKALKSMKSVGELENCVSDLIVSKGEEQPVNLAGESSSCQTSSVGQRGEYSKGLLILKKMLCDPSKTNLKWRFSVTLGFLCTLALGMAGLNIEKYIVGTGFAQFSSMMEAGIKISSVNQLLEILYNNAIMTPIYCPENGDRCKQLQQFSQVMLNEFYLSYPKYFQNYFQDVTSLSGSKVAGSYRQLLWLNMNDELVEVSHQQVIEYFYKWLMTSSDPTSTNDELKDALRLLSLNWPTLKELAKSTLNYNITSCSEQLRAITTMLILVLSGIALLVGIVLVSFGLYFNFLEKQKQLVLRLYRRVSRQIAAIMMEYYQQIKQKKEELPYPRIEEQHIHEGVIEEYRKNTINNLVPILVVLGIPSFLLLVSPILVILKAQTTLEFSSALIATENQMLQSFIELKAFNLGITQSKMAEKIFRNINSTQIGVGRIVRTMIPFFKQMDSAFESDLNSLLTTNVFELIGGQLPEQVGSECQKLRGHHILSNGVMSGVNFLHRNTMNSLLYLSTTTEVDKASYFKTTAFQQMDDFLLYYSMANEKINNRIVEAFKHQYSAGQRNVEYDTIFNYVACPFLALLWFVHALEEKENYSHLCGYCSQLPEFIMIKKHVLNQTKDILHLTF